MSEPMKFAAVGTGWRTEFFLRVAQAAPDKLRAVAVVGRTASSLDRIAQKWQVPTTLSIGDLARYEVDFVAASVPWAATPGLVLDLAEAGYQVYCETPPAPTLAGLRQLWTAIGSRSRQVQIGEQYYRMPGHASRLSLVRDGLIGQPNGVEIASTHLYHAVALVRDYLGVGLSEATVSARSFTAPMINPLTPAGWKKDPQPEDLPTTIATIDFGDGRYGLYNFVDNQWWNPLLSRRLAIRGSLGEIVDDTVLRWADGVPVTSHLEYRRVGVDMSLEGNELAHVSFDGKVVYTNPWRGSRLSEDDIAVASHLYAEGLYARGEGPQIYSLADGIHDHAISLAIEESARTGHDVRVAGEPWMS